MRLPKSGDYCKLYAKQKLIKVTRAQKPSEDTKGEIIIRKRRRTDNTIAKRKGQKDKQRSTKHYTKN